MRQQQLVTPRSSRHPARPQIGAGARTNSDLILDLTIEDFRLAEACERSEISSFEYADGHTCPSTDDTELGADINRVDENQRADNENGRKDHDATCERIRQ